MIDVIRDQTSEVSRMELLAEEAGELAVAASKCARILRGENPTPISEDAARRHLIEEFSDVINVARSLCIKADEEFIAAKNIRWVQRMNGIFEEERT